MAAFHHHLLFFLVVALAAGISNHAVAAAGDDNVHLRKVALSQAVDVLSNYRHGTSDVETLRRAMAVVNREVQGYWKPIFDNLDKVRNSGADERSKEEAFAAAKALLNRELGQGPDAVKIDFKYV